MVSAPPSTPEEIYLHLLKRFLTRYGFDGAYRALGESPKAHRRFFKSLLQRRLGARGLELVRRSSFDAELRREGKDLPADAETMIGLRRLHNIQHCVTEVLRRGVPGDLMETGVWRGGASILMAGILRIYGDTNRLVWLADSFQGLPPPDPDRYPADAGDTLFADPQLAVSLDQVKANFEKYDLLNDQIRFLPGWFRDTLHNAPITRLAVLRLDGDLYESTIVALQSLYPKLSPGGYVIVDDYGVMPNCKLAVEDFRREAGIKDEIHVVDSCAVFWRRES
jgi:O-methyltransferase